MAMTHWKLVPRKKFESPAGFLAGLLIDTRCGCCCCCGGVHEETTPGITALRASLFWRIDSQII